MKYFGLIETKIFHFHGIFKGVCVGGGGGGGFKRTPEPPLDPPSHVHVYHMRLDARTSAM